MKEFLSSTLQEATEKNRYVELPITYQTYFPNKYLL